MSRHRDIRSMKYDDEYDGYDEVFGRSVEEEHCVSPGAEQFLYDRNKQRNIASFITKSDTNVDEKSIGNFTSVEEHEAPESTNIQFMSCVETVRNVIGDMVPEALLNKKIVELNFNAEAVLNDIFKSMDSQSRLASNTGMEGHLDTPTGTKQTSKLVQVADSSSIKVIPATTGNVVKGFDISGLDSKDFLLPSKSNTPTRCRSPSSICATPEQDIKTKKSEESRDAMAIYEDRQLKAKEQLHLVVVGHVDAGKSTLLGRLLCNLGQVSSRLIEKYQHESKKLGKQSFAYAWVMDETGEERERGITMDIGYSTFETETKSITLLDAPGHKDFIPNMITGVTQADAALLVVDATRGEFETGYDSGGQTREHAFLLRSLGISQIAVVVNKLDTINWSEERYNEIVDKMNTFLRQIGFRDNVTFVPCSGLSGQNIIESSEVRNIASWYSGPTLLEVIDSFKCPERPIMEPLRFSVNDIFKGIGTGFTVSGRIETGMVSINDKILVLPANEIAIVKGIAIDEVSTKNGFAGDHVSLTISGTDQQKVGIGDIICNPKNPVSVTTCFEAHIVIFAIGVPIIKGLPIVLHIQSLVEPAVITKLIHQLHKSTGEVLKRKPRCLPTNSSAIIEITTHRSICLHLYKDVKSLGRVMLRVSGTTIAAGLVTKIH